MAATRKMAKVKSTASHSPEALRKTCLGASRRNSTEKAFWEAPGNSWWKGAGRLPKLGWSMLERSSQHTIGKIGELERLLVRNNVWHILCGFFQDSCCARRYGYLYTYLVPVQVAKNDESSTHLNMSPFVGSLLAAKWHLGEGSSAIRQGSSNHSNGRFGGAGRVSVCSGISIDFHCILLSLLRHQSFARFNLSVSTSCIFQRINAAIQLGSSITSPCHVFHMIQHVLKIYNQVYSIGTRMHFKYIYIYIYIR